MINYESKMKDTKNLKEANFDYAYPNKLDLKPGSKFHTELLDKLLSRAGASAIKIQERFPSWNKQDQSLTAYIPSDSEEQEVIYNDPRKPVSIVFPYSYAILETLLSYMMTAFFRDPIFRYEGYSPEDVMGSILLEKVINLHTNKFKVMLNLHTMFRDNFVYGIGPTVPIWKRSSNGLFEGNALINIDPYRYLPDPNVAANNIQDGEFVGWSSDTNLMNLLSEENSNEDMFNVNYLKILNNLGTSIYGEDRSARNKFSQSKIITDSDLNPITELFFYLKIVPRDWKLSDVNVPEKWFFRIASDAVITTARPADFDHDKFPLAVACSDFDGYSSTPLSRLEMLGGLQGVLDWLFNSHIANVRKAINDTIIYDPYLINSKDLKDPKAGKLIRMRRPAWGQGKIADAIQQLKINDITQNNMVDSNLIVNLMQKISATDDATMGAMRSGGPERLTKAEFQGTASGAMGRLERVAKIIGLQAMQDIGEFFAEHTQQVMEDDTYIKVTGAWSEVLKQQYAKSITNGRMKVSPDDLDINYDVLVRDGSIPGGNNAINMQMFQTLAQNPELTQKFDIVKVFKTMMEKEGEKNVDDYIRNGGGQIDASIQNDENVANEVQKGNLIPMTGIGR